LKPFPPNYGETGVIAGVISGLESIFNSGLSLSKLSFNKLLFDEFFFYPLKGGLSISDDD